MSAGIGLAEKVNAAALQMTDAQKEAVRRSLMARNLAPPENAELWLAIREGIGGDAYDGALSVAEMRAAIEDLPLDSWEAINNLIFVLHRGNVFDEQFKALPGGGIHFGFAGIQGGRYETFLAQFEDEAVRIRRAIGKEQLRVFDVGCWQGTLVCALLQRGFLVGGMDICSEVGPVVKERVALLKPEHAEGFLGFASGWAHEVLPALIEPKPPFDMVTCQETLEHIPTAVLQQTCDAILGAARHAILITVPGWDDSWGVHLHVFTIAEFERLFHADWNEIVILQEPGAGVYTTVLIRPGRISGVG